ncbi:MULTISPECIES: hypothetical protein [unclassified Microcoleus]|uniref:hypothetical protein n=1 Tax=unclassified Microcoleus TaxID=2642155 RepID=UPI002FD1AC4C
MTQQQLTLEERLTLIEAQLIEARNKQKKKRHHKGVTISFDCEHSDHDKLLLALLRSGLTKSQFMRIALKKALEIEGDPPLVISGTGANSKPPDEQIGW